MIGDVPYCVGLAALEDCDAGVRNHDSNVLMRVDVLVVLLQALLYLGHCRMNNRRIDNDRQILCIANNNINLHKTFLDWRCFVVQKRCGRPCITICIKLFCTAFSFCHDADFTVPESFFE